MCKLSGRCIPKAFLCDGNEDCDKALNQEKSDDENLKNCCKRIGIMSFFLMLFLRIFFNVIF